MRPPMNEFLAPSTAAPPFAMPRPPIVSIVDLPLPPSVNRIWRSNKAGKLAVSRSAEYRLWIEQADILIMTMGGMRGRKTIKGPFIALIEIKKPNINSDLDNRIKAVLDYAQSRAFVDNDRNCVSITAQWSAAALHGCRLTLREVFE
jgi:Holliday junction resolvase RusA-like endonuclease